MTATPKLQGQIRSDPIAWARSVLRFGGWPRRNAVVLEAMSDLVDTIDRMEARIAALEVEVARTDPPPER